MTEWLVSVAVGGAFDSGPSLLVEAETAEDAARDGIYHLRTEDGGYGVECQHCEGLNTRSVRVVEVEKTTLVTSELHWQVETP